MSAKKVSGSPSISVKARQQSLTIPVNSIRICKNGIEFRSSTAITLWTEMTVDLHSHVDRKRLHCTGVVVACSGDDHRGYVISMLFTHLSRQAQLTLDGMRSSRLN